MDDRLRQQLQQILGQAEVEVGLENGWVQEMGAPENYLPDFEREGLPFSLSADQRK